MKKCAERVEEKRDLLTELIHLCKCGVHVTANRHKDYYQSVESYMDDHPDDLAEIPANIFTKMVETDTIIEVQFYPNTPISFHIIYHYDVNQALKDAANFMREFRFYA